MRDIRDGSEQDLVWNWARAEIESERHSRHYNLPPRLLQFLQNDQRPDLTQEDWKVLADAVFSVRGPLLKGLRRLSTGWSTGVLNYEELLDLKIMGWSGFVSWAPSGSFEEFVRAVNRGQPPVTKEWLSHYLKLRGSFDETKIKGCPILVSKKKDGPYTIVEGYGRLSVLTSHYLEGKLPAGEINIVLGICERLEDWYLHDNSNSDHLFM